MFQVRSGVELPDLVVAMQARRLSNVAMALRVFHIAVAVIGLASLGYLWTCAVTGRRDGWLGLAIGWLGVEGIAILIGRGSCPLGPLQRRLGDPTPCFELVLPARAAKAVFPVLFAVTAVGLTVIAWRTYS
jgi:hypothetical protein